MYRTLFFLAALSMTAFSTTDEAFVLDASLEDQPDFLAQRAPIDLGSFELDLQAVSPIVFPEQDLDLIDVFDELHRRGLGVTSLV